MRATTLRTNRITNLAGTAPPQTVTLGVEDRSDRLATTAFVHALVDQRTSATELLGDSLASIGSLTINELQAQVLGAQSAEVDSLVANTFTSQQVNVQSGVFQSLTTDTLTAQQLSVTGQLRLGSGAQTGYVWTATATDGSGSWQPVPPYLQLVSVDSTLTGDGRPASPLGVNLSALESALGFLRPSQLVAGSNVTLSTSGGNVVVGTAANVSFTSLTANQLRVSGTLKLGSSSSVGQVWTATDTQGNGEWRDLPSGLTEVTTDSTLQGTGRADNPLRVNLTEIRSQFTEFLLPTDVVAGDHISVTVTESQQVVIAASGVLTRGNLVAGENVVITTNDSGQVVIAAVPPVL